MFLKYLSIGVLNTLLHWGVFFLCVLLLSINQSVANVIAFLVAVSFSFMMNAKFTFNREATGSRYLLFILFMGAFSYLVGYCADQFNLFPLITLIVFSSLSLVLGFIYSKFIVFK